MRTLKIAIAGYGSAGRRFDDLLSQRGHGVHIFDPVVLPTGSPKWCNLIKGKDAAIICSPSSMHYTQAAECLREGVPVLIEKPAATESSWTRELLKIQAKTGAPGFVGYNLRYVTPLDHLVKWSKTHAYHARIAFGFNLNFWRPGTEMRKGYAPWRAQGGGIMLDASHEIDTAIRMFGRPLEVAAFTSPFRSHFKFGDTDGSADLLLRFDRDKTASIHLDYYSADYHRSVRIFSPTPLQSVIGLDTWSIGARDQSVAATYARELEDFLSVVVNSKSPHSLATLADGHLVLEVIDAARRSVKSGRVQRLKQLKKNWKAGA